MNAEGVEPILSLHRSKMKSARVFWLLSYLLLTSTLAHASRHTKQSAVPAVALPAAPAAPLAPAPVQKEVTIKADTLSIDIPADSYRAAGSVRLEQDGVSLLADSVIYSRLTSDALAQGGVFMEKGGDTLKGDRLSLNLVSQKGEVTNGELFIKKNNFRVRAERMEKTGDEDYRLERGSFTTCDGDKPSWRFEARKVEITLDEFATGRDAVFYAGDIPLLYTPYLIFPIKRERQSGLLLPKAGHSTLKGVYFTQPFYWVITPSQDATFALDIQSSRGVGLGVDYRYMRPLGSEGRLQTYGIYDTQADMFRGELNQKHLELFSPNTTLASDIHLITDRNYYREHGDLPGQYNRQLLESVVSLDHRWERYGVTGEIRYSEDLVAPNNDATLQRLPELTFIAAGEKLGPFFLSMDSRFINFQRNEGVTGQRLELHPRLALYTKPAGAVDLSFYGGYHERVYNVSSGDVRSGIWGMGQADAGATMSVPLERVYDARVRHVLIPAIQYGFVQQRRDDFMPFDWNDRVFGQSIASWSLTSFVTGKFTQEAAAPEYRDLLYLKISQGYQFSGERRDLLTLVDPGHRLTDLMLESRVTPVQGATIALDGRYNTVDGNLSTGNLAVEVKGEGANLALFGYRYSRSEVDYLEGRFQFPVARQLSATVFGRYSFDRGAFLESRYALEYKRQCWSVIASFSDRPGTPERPGIKEIRANREFSVNFTLAGIGALGPVRAF